VSKIERINQVSQNSSPQHTSERLVTRGSSEIPAMRKNGGAGRAGRVSQKPSFFRDTNNTTMDELEDL
jgi:hypothetical protein